MTPAPAPAPLTSYGCLTIDVDSEPGAWARALRHREEGNLHHREPTRTTTERNHG